MNPVARFVTRFPFAIVWANLGILLCVIYCLERLVMTVWDGLKMLAITPWLMFWVTYWSDDEEKARKRQAALLRQFYDIPKK